jgi:hypothetical protein
VGAARRADVRGTVLGFELVFINCCPSFLVFVF